MKKAFEVFRREYVERVRKKSFLIITLVGPFLMLGLGVIPNLLIQVGSGKSKPLAVVDRSGQVAGQLEPLLNPEGSRLKDGSLRYPVLVVDLGDRSLEEVQRELNGRIASRDIFGYLMVGEEDLGEEAVVNYFARNASNLSDIDAIQDALSDLVIPIRFRGAGMSMEMEGIRKLTRRVRLEPAQVGKDGTVETAGQGAQLGKLIAAYAMVIIFYITFIMWGMSIMRGVVEEKSSKVIEVILASVSPRQLMAGKVLGIGAVALTQYLVWAGTGVAAYFILTLQAGLGEWVSGLDAWTVIAFIGYFVLGYLLYSSYFAALGACCNSDQEAQQLQQVGIIPILAGFFLSFYVLQQADTPLAMILSLIPLLTPFLMIVRMAVQTPPLWEIGLSVVLMVGAIAVMTMLAAKVFRVGILMTGKKPTLPEIWRWIRYA